MFPEPEPSTWQQQRRSRKRQIPHADGNFATFVYIPVARRKVSRRLDAARASLRQLCQVAEHLRARDENAHQGSRPCIGVQDASDSQPPLTGRQCGATTATGGNSINEEAQHTSLGRSGQESMNVQGQAPNDVLTDSLPVSSLGTQGKKRRIQGQWQAHTTHDVADAADLHISLSRTIMLQFHLIEPFLAQIASKLKQVKCFTIELQDRLDIFSNLDQSCFFAAFPVSPICARNLVAPVVQDVNEVVTKFGGAPFAFRPFRPHVSVAWTAEDIRPALHRVSQIATYRQREVAQNSPGSGQGDQRADVEGDQHCWPQVEDALQQLEATLSKSRESNVDSGDDESAFRRSPGECNKDQVADCCNGSPNRSRFETNAASQVEAGAAGGVPGDARIWIKVQKVCVSVGNRITTVHLQGAVSDSDSSSGSSDTESM
uniref:U6 snRNA phosphodiesterase 1 n=1 Tax=Neospora caninum (strain Liverpool) TaxID=572307 RepID=A0A0F7UIK6_NEOCL|nr:TPA: hypothetical protein BN1204_037210 [Neospora caninum Liverpool]